MINFQCGYRALSNMTMVQNAPSIYLSGCLSTAENFVKSNVYVFAGIGIGLLVFEVLNIILAAGLAVDIHKEKELIKAQKKTEKGEEMHKL